MGISNKGTKAKTIISCDNAFVTNIVLLPLRFRAKNIVLLPLCFRAKNIVLLPLRFRAKNICCPDAPGKRPVGTEINPTLW
ncbi:hypothetical protein [Lysinibacillus sp. NPDC092081]|uniref:hypothetical protein n=1 Tax=Lysinibacillus sp. NPDC092081 TaxID=3364131 RepID=UPI003829A38D